MKLLWFAVAATTLFISNVAFANTRICVSVQQKSWYKPVAPSARSGAAPGGDAARAAGDRADADAPPPRPGTSDTRVRAVWRPVAVRGVATAVQAAPSGGAAAAPHAAARQPARDRSDAAPAAHAGVRSDARAGLRRRRRSLRAADDRRALPARERLDGVRPLLGNRARGEGRSRRAGRVRRAGAADRLRAAAQQVDHPHHHARERAARRQRAEPAHDQRHRPPAVRDGDGDTRRRAADRAGAQRNAAARPRAASSRRSASRSATGASCAPGVSTRSAA